MIWSSELQQQTSVETSYASKQFLNTGVNEVILLAEKRPSIDRSILSTSRKKRRHVRITL